MTSALVTPEWDLADRMRKALRSANVGAGEMAAFLGVSRASVSAWMAGATRPKRAHVLLWAARCGVSVEWMTGGEVSDEEAGVMVRRQGLEPRTRWLRAMHCTRGKPAVSM